MRCKSKVCPAHFPVLSNIAWDGEQIVCCAAYFLMAGSLTYAHNCPAISMPKSDNLTGLPVEKDSYRVHEDKLSAICSQLYHSTHISGWCYAGERGCPCATGANDGTGPKQANYCRKRPGPPILQGSSKAHTSRAAAQAACAGAQSPEPTAKGIHLYPMTPSASRSSACMNIESPHTCHMTWT